MYQMILDRLKIHDVLKFYGVKFKTNKLAYCNIHNDKHASMLVYANRQIFSCRTCGAGGDLINYVAKLYKINNFEASRKINIDFRLGLDRNLTKEEILEAQNLHQRKDLERKLRIKRENKLLLYIDGFCMFNNLSKELGMYASKDVRRKYRGLLEFSVLRREFYLQKIQEVEDDLYGRS